MLAQTNILTWRKHLPTFSRNGGVKKVPNKLTMALVGPKICQAEAYELVAEEAVKQLGLDLTGVGKPSWEV